MSVAKALAIIACFGHGGSKQPALRIKRKFIADISYLLNIFVCYREDMESSPTKTKKPPFGGFLLFIKLGNVCYRFHGVAAVFVGIN